MLELVERSPYRDVGVVYADERVREMVDRVWHGTEVQFSWFRDTRRIGTGTTLQGVPYGSRDEDCLILPADLINSVDLQAVYEDHVRAGADITPCVRSSRRRNVDWGRP